MNNRYLYRAKRCDTGEWVEGYLIHARKDCYMCENPYECGSFGIAYRECIDWEKIEANICRITGCDNALYACENDNYISLWEIYWNFNDEDNCLSTVEVIGMMKGKKVVMNGKYHVSEKNKGKVFEVASDPYSVCGTVVVKLIGLAGCYALDGLTEVVE